MPSKGEKALKKSSLHNESQAANQSSQFAGQAYMKQIARYSTNQTKVLEQAANLQAKVIEYLLKKGYNRTERTLRAESSALDREGNQQQDRVEDIGNIKYSRGLRLLFGWISGNLDIYKVSMSSTPSHLASCSIVGVQSCNASPPDMLSCG